VVEVYVEKCDLFFNGVHAVLLSLCIISGRGLFEPTSSRTEMWESTDGLYYRESDFFPASCNVDSVGIKSAGIKEKCQIMGVKAVNY
jgi:hypothetical protein